MIFVVFCELYTCDANADTLVKALLVHMRVGSGPSGQFWCTGVGAETLQTLDYDWGLWAHELESESMQRKGKATQGQTRKEK